MPGEPFRFSNFVPYIEYLLISSFLISGFECTSRGKIVATDTVSTASLQNPWLMGEQRAPLPTSGNTQGSHRGIPDALDSVSHQITNP